MPDISPWSERKESLATHKDAFFGSPNIAKPSLASTAGAVHATINAAFVHTVVILPVNALAGGLQRAASVQTNTAEVNKQGLDVVENLAATVQAQIQRQGRRPAPGHLTRRRDARGTS